MMLRFLGFMAWLSVTGLIAYSSYLIGESGSAPKIARMEQDLAEARAKAGAGCGTVYMAVWPDYACGLTGWAIPAVLRPILCTQSIKVYRQGDIARVQLKADSLGPGTPGLTLYLEKGSQEKIIPLTWKAEFR